ncbi:hypothetical protein DFJ73DRAFT_759348 [Zopfochytrium polystomum]|nr:hypothetical protein DFJ73DRAFT_759348 [Zopfochytrium polystomum]
MWPDKGQHKGDSASSPARARRVILMRGCPGSGKSYEARTILVREAVQGTVADESAMPTDRFFGCILSTDDFFLTPVVDPTHPDFVLEKILHARSQPFEQTYVFDKDRLEEAHAWNARRCELAMSGASVWWCGSTAHELSADTNAACSTDFLLTGTSSAVSTTPGHSMRHSHLPSASGEPYRIIVIDNTNTQRWEARAYAELAQRFGYSLETREPETSWWCERNAAEMAQRNRHGVSEVVIRRMLQRWEDAPTAAGWTMQDLLEAPTQRASQNQN